MVGDGRGHVHCIVRGYQNNICCYPPFIVVSVDEVTMIDNTQWLSIHLYVVRKWRSIPILLCFEVVSLFATFDNILSLMVKCMLDFGGLEVKKLVRKLVSIGCDKSSVF
jgi:hypothetical protein